MPPTDSVSFNNLGRSILSLRRDQVHSMDNTHDSSNQEVELDAFQKRVSDRFADLSAVGGGAAGADDLLSLGWVRKLLEAFVLCHEEFRVILLNHKLQVLKPPTDRLVADFFDRSVKGLDVCNAIRDGIEQIRQWHKLLDIVLCALDNQRSIGEGQFRRAKKALIDLAIAMLDEKDSGGTIAHRNRSFGRNNVSREHHRLGHFRSLSWSVSRSWSAARQLQAIGNNLNAPRGNEIAATSGLAVPIYTMGSVMLLVMWALVAAIPCQDRGLHIHFTLPRQQYSWAGPMMLIHERILEESKKRERRNACGLLKEIYQIEKWARVMNELGDSLQFPLTEEKEGEVRQKVQELSQISEAIKVGLDPLERQVREVFRKIVRSRTEGLDSMGKTNHPE